jgi:uncharacterized protein YjeT (DUF2065 family)
LDKGCPVWEHAPFWASWLGLGLGLGRPGPSSRREVPVQELLIAFALLLVLEGVWPFLSPASFRRTLERLGAEGDRALRIAGLASMVAGVGLLYLVN